jgi:hypothetical protein
MPGQEEVGSGPGPPRLLRDRHRAPRRYSPPAECYKRVRPPAGSAPGTARTDGAETTARGLGGGGHRSRRRKEATARPRQSAG